MLVCFNLQHTGYLSTCGVSSSHTKTLNFVLFNLFRTPSDLVCVSEKEWEDMHIHLDKTRKMDGWIAVCK